MEHMGLVSFNITQAKPPRSINGAGRHDENMGVIEMGGGCEVVSNSVK